MKIWKAFKNMKAKVKYKEVNTVFKLVHKNLNLSSNFIYNNILLFLNKFKNYFNFLLIIFFIYLKSS